MMRGKIRNREHASQLRDFSGMRYGNITPTDIDAYFEFGGKVFVLVEVKHGNAKMPYGQRLGLQRLADVISETKPSLLVVASTDSETGNDIHLHQCKVTEYRSSGMWRIPRHTVTVRKIIDAFLYKNGVIN